MYDKIISEEKYHKLINEIASARKQMALIVRIRTILIPFVQLNTVRKNAVLIQNKVAENV